MLAITVELLHGTTRLTGASDTAITGSDTDAGEWPPSPARLFSALVAGGGTGKGQPLTDASELLLLERAGAPRILGDPASLVLRSGVNDRFVVGEESYIDNKPPHGTMAVQEYVGRIGVVVHPGVRLAPRSPVVTYVWDDVDPDDSALRALAVRAARVGYLGCSDSPARVSVSTALGEERDAWTPDPAGDTILPIPYEGFLEALDDAFARFQGGEAVRRVEVPNRYARYRPPGARAVPGGQPTALWLRFDPAVSGRRLLAVTETLRAAVLERYAAEVGGDPGKVPAAVSGHGLEGSSYQHAYFLALPDAGHPHARGHFHGAAVVLPAGCDPEVVETTRAALWRLRTLARPAVFETSLRPHGGENRPLAAAPERWSRSSRHWVSATPVVHERHRRPGPDLEEVARWCAHAGVGATPISFRTSRFPLMEGALSLAPVEVYRSGRERRPYSHLEVVFDAPVPGPLVLGGARQFGFGLMLPLSSARGSDG